MSRLEKVVGTEIIDDIRLGHTWYEFNVLQSFVAEQLSSKKSKAFVEIGVHEGGLSYMMIPKFPDLCYIGVELHCYLTRPKVKQLYLTHNQAELLCTDCYGGGVKYILEILTHKIIYCDGGGKAAELKHFKKLCYPGDILMSHDYHDRKSLVIDVPPEYLPTNPEVAPEDIIHMTEDETFEAIAVPFLGTRIVAWRKL